MEDTFNPHGRGKGGFLGKSACGCTRGWTAELDCDGRGDVIQWLLDGCTVTPLMEGEEIKREICPTHAVDDTPSFTRATSTKEYLRKVRG